MLVLEVAFAQSGTSSAENQKILFQSYPGKIFIINAIAKKQQKYPVSFSLQPYIEFLIFFCLFMKLLAGNEETSATHQAGPRF